MATGKAPRNALTHKPGFKGNKSFLPSKPCAGCGLPMTWRKRWAKTWDEVRYCSDACRRSGPKAP